MSRLIVMLLLLLNPVSALFAATEKTHDIDYLALAAVLIKDGHYERAEIALGQAESADASGGQAIEDKARFYTLKGLVLLKRQEYAGAQQAFESAFVNGQGEAVTYVYLAQAAYGNQDYRTSLEAIERAGDTAQSIKALYTIKAQSHWKLEQREPAWATLIDARERFPQEAVFQRQQIFFLLELKLYQDAVEIGKDYLAREQAKLEDYLAIGSALRQSKQSAKAIDILEQAKVLYPNDLRVIIELANAYLDNGATLVAADLFLVAASLDSQYLSEAAELYRRAGKFEQALNLNAQVREKDKKLKQRMAILLEHENYDLAAAMERPLYRVGLLNDEDIRYATAYSLFKAGSFEQASTQLDFITRPDLFRKSTELRKVMQECRDNRWRCY